MSLRFRLLAACCVTLSAPATAQDGAPQWEVSPSFQRAMEPMVPRAVASERIVTTRHSIVLGGKRLRYHATVTETPLNGSDGTPAAVAVTFAYTADGVSDPAHRPLLFVFNGGPGASSSPLHLKAFGPRRLVGEGAALHMADNPFTLLDAADLVFVDPVGTGASMPVAGKDASSFWSVGGDARAVSLLIDTWKTTHGRVASPTVLLGESYGTTRALAMLNEAMKARTALPDAIILLSLAIGWSDLPVTSDVTKLPTLAAVAWYHDAVDRGGRTVDQQFAEARRFAESDYIAALVQGSSLPAAERNHVAARVAQFIGLPADTIEKAGLTVDQHDFMLGLLSAKGLRTGQLDARATRQVAQSNFHPPFDDPSMSLGSDTSATIEAYIRDELGYTMPSPYRSLNLGINFKWNWEGGRGGAYSDGAFAPYLASAMAIKPSLRVFTGGGYYDITTPVEAGIFALDQVRVPADRRTTRIYPTGHAIAEDGTGLAALSKDLHEFIARLGQR